MNLYLLLSSHEFRFLEDRIDFMRTRESENFHLLLFFNQIVLANLMESYLIHSSIRYKHRANLIILP